MRGVKIPQGLSRTWPSKKLNGSRELM